VTAAATRFRWALTVTTIHSVAGTLEAGAGLLVDRPFRAHHTCSEIALIGGGSFPRPGERASRTTALLDDCEFPRRALETLRQPRSNARPHRAPPARRPSPRP
jgi:magnesium chelatase family protein